ncbi:MULTISPECIES: hypothetical protein [unclassified Streptomyces]|uniref:hypothetical protein n=1 Tax=unclassified Streptomyces TaxID=2593676 RepID=UPI0004534622|nr:hypothetical protein [Streptomyces sp. PCS3-D2]WKV76566.1 hypothetical protein AW27_034000 [Streptomyces sp. PCS3-D2]
MDMNLAGTGRAVCGVWAWGGRTVAAFPSRIVVVVVVVCAAVMVACGVPAEPVAALLTASGVLAAHRPPTRGAVAAPASPVLRRVVRRRA